MLMFARAYVDCEVAADADASAQAFAHAFDADTWLLSSAI